MHSQGMRARVRDLYFVQGMGMRTIGAMPGMPTRRTVRLWVCADPVTVRPRGDTGCRIRWRPDWGRARVRADRSPLVFCQIFVGRFGVSFSPFERLFLGRFGFGQSCGLSVIA